MARAQTTAHARRMDVQLVVNGRKHQLTFDSDVPDIDVTFVGEPEQFNPGGIKGISRGMATPDPHRRTRASR